jgi:aconitate decarboxylase
MGYVDRPRPATGLAGKFSFQYGVAAALLDGRVDMDSFADARRFAPDMEAMLTRIELKQDESISGRLDRMHADVAVRLRDGTVVQKRCSAPDGSWTRPVPPERIKDKARSLLDSCLSASAAKAFWRWVEEEPSKLKVAELMQSLKGEPTAH